MTSPPPVTRIISGLSSRALAASRRAMRFSTSASRPSCQARGSCCHEHGDGKKQHPSRAMLTLPICLARAEKVKTALPFEADYPPVALGNISSRRS
jgi:hypothetical protein